MTRSIMKRTFAIVLACLLVALSALVVPARAQAKRPNIVVIVADDGQGIAAEFLPYVFERFRQADATTTRKYGGLGLGLAIVRHLVELHGGTVRVESEGPGRGATFAVCLPICPLPVDAGPSDGGADGGDAGSVVGTKVGLGGERASLELVALRDDRVVRDERHRLGVRVRALGSGVAGSALLLLERLERRFDLLVGRGRRIEAEHRDLLLDALGGWLKPENVEIVYQ